MRGRVEQLIVDAQHNIQHARLLDRRAHHHAAYALIQIGLQRSAGLVDAAGLDHQIAARPVGIGNRPVASERQPAARNDNRITIGLCLVLPAPVYRVEVEQMGVGCRIAARVVDLHKLQVGPVPGGAQRQFTDAAKAVDTYLDGHVASLRLTRTDCGGPLFSE